MTAMSWVFLGIAVLATFAALLLLFGLCRAAADVVEDDGEYDE